MNIVKNIENIKAQINTAQLIVVTKKQNIENIQKVYNTGERNFGENRVNDLLMKKELLPKDIKWHMIGHLQTNKVKSIIPFIEMIHSVDSIKLLKKINDCGKQENRIINCLIQIKIAKETTKYGFKIEESKKLLKSNLQSKYPYTNIKGIMGMASFTTNKTIIKTEFKKLESIYKLLPPPNNILSMGMSNDYKIACKLGSNMIRIGSSIFQDN